MKVDREKGYLLVERALGFLAVNFDVAGRVYP
jgi:hypothetical protein